MAKYRVHRRLADVLEKKRALQQKPGAAGEPRMENDPHLNRGCMGCLAATLVFFAALGLSLILGRCSR